jgi:hypothetical protein
MLTKRGGHGQDKTVVKLVLLKCDECDNEFTAKKGQKCKCGSEKVSEKKEDS